MHKEDVIGELLYIGFVAEKGRCYRKNWGFKYKKILRKHIYLMLQLSELMLNKEPVDEVLRDFIVVCNQINEIGKFYKISLNIGNIDWKDGGNNFERINQIIYKLLLDLKSEINRLFVNKKHIYSLLCILHNLPRVYLGENKITLCNLKQPAISEEAALQYAIQNIDNNVYERYQLIFSDLNL